MTKTIDQLLTKLNAAVKAANDAEAKVTTAQAELVSRSKTVGLLLLEAKKLHPAVKDFEAFLKKVKGLKLARAYDCMRIAGGRTTDEEIRKETRDRVKKHRANKKKLQKPAPAPKAEPEPISVTSPHVTESAEVSIEQRKAEMADLSLTPEERAAKASARALTEFTVACRTWLPKVTVEADRQKARLLVSELTSGKPKAKAA
jgi:hypothetical protein